MVMKTGTCICSMQVSITEHDLAKPNNKSCISYRDGDMCNDYHGFTSAMSVVLLSNALCL